LGLGFHGRIVNVNLTSCKALLVRLCDCVESRLQFLVPLSQEFLVLLWVRNHLIKLRRLFEKFRDSVPLLLNCFDALAPKFIFGLEYLSVFLQALMEAICIDLLLVFTSLLAAERHLKPLELYLSIVILKVENVLHILKLSLID